MRKILPALCVLIFLLAFPAACSAGKSSKAEGFDFSVKWGVGGFNEVNTYEDTLTKDLVRDGTKTVDFQIPDEDFIMLYEAFIENEIYDLPEELSLPNRHGEPAVKLILTFTHDGMTKNIVWENALLVMDGTLPESHQRLLRFFEVVLKYVINTDAYKDLPDPNGAYL